MAPIKIRCFKLNLSYKRKLIILLLLFAIIPVLIISCILYLKSSAIISEQVSASFINRLRFSVQNIDNMLISTEELSYPVIVDNELGSKLVLSPDSELFNQYETAFYLNGILNSILYANKNLDSVYLYAIPGKWLIGGVKVGRTVPENEIKDTEWFKTVSSYEDLPRWSLVKGITQGNGETKGLIVSYKFIGKNINNQSLGILSLNLNRNVIEKYLETAVVDNKTAVVVLEPDNRVVGAKNPEMIGNKFEQLGVILENWGKEGYFIDKLNSSEVLIAYYTSPYTKWKYAMVTTMRSVTDKIFGIFVLAMLSFIFIVILGIIIALILPSNMIRPINTLSKAMKTVKTGRFDCRIDEIRTDEFGELYVGFNDMVENLNNLIHELYQQKLVKKDIQLKMMQSQINAHFLYNTLDVIHWIARVNKVEDICTITFALSKYFRISLSEGKDLISIKEAVELITSYINIHRIKSEKEIDLKLDVPGSVLHYKVLKYIFQPIIENAIQHGIEKTRRNGVLCFTCVRREDILEFTFEDNGIGITPAALNNIKSDLEDRDLKKEGNFALRNINNQIKIYYGDEYGLEIESEYDRGTIVRIEIPAPGEGEDNVQITRCG